MGQYSTGDIILAPIALGGARGKKVRPGMIIGSDQNQVLLVCPVSGHSPGDGAYLPLDLADFAEGGLDLFATSYVLASETCRVRESDVIGKKGRLNREFMETVTRLRNHS